MSRWLGLVKGVYMWEGRIYGIDTEPHDIFSRE